MLTVALFDNVLGDLVYIWQEDSVSSVLCCECSVQPTGGSAVCYRASPCPPPPSAVNLRSSEAETENTPAHCVLEIKYRPHLHFFLSLKT